MRYFRDTVTPKAMALIIVLLMAFADFLTMQNLFLDLGSSDGMELFGKDLEVISEALVYSVTMVALLEGNPWFLGMTATALWDKSSYKTNDKTNAKVGFIISLAGLVLSWLLEATMRGFLIAKNGGLAAYMTFDKTTGKSLYEGFVLDICLACTPVLTSILATVASWTAFRSEQETKLVWEIQERYKRFLRSQKDFLECLYKNEDSKVALWSSLTIRPNGPMPQDFDSFRQECFSRIRTKLIENCITQYPDQIKYFNAAVEDLLRHCIEEMSKYTTVPDEIRGIELDGLIAEYDAAREAERKPGEAWDYTVAGRDLEAELKTLLDNAVVTAQFKTSHKPRHMEGEVNP